MDFTALNDFVSGSSHEHGECPHCCGVVRMHNGLCLGCLVQTGLTEENRPEGENLDTLLSEIE